MTQTVTVALGMVLRAGQHGAELLLTRRAEGTVLSGYWEFPGGKVEIGESLEAAVRRELLEEVDLHIEPVESLNVVEHVYPHATVCLHGFYCRIEAGEVVHRAVTDHRWIPPHSLPSYELPPANGPLITQIIDDARAGRLDAVLKHR